jgi:predicted GIY-YIG superfamily endonuclease
MSNIITDFCFTGHATDKNINKIKKTLNALIRQVGIKKLYIGKTGDPSGRFNKHKQNKWKKMIILYQSKSKNYVEEVESILVAYTYEFNKNKTGGGGGPLSSKTQFNYVYALIG